MAKVRAYRIAEELGLDRKDLVEKALAVGIELTSAMATLDEAEADTLREKLGGRRIGRFEEQRVVSKGGAVIRRRKKVIPDPEPEPVPEPVAPVATPEEAPAQAVTPAPDATPGPTPAEPEGPPPAAPAAARPAGPAPANPGAAARRGGPAGPSQDAGRTKQRKQFREVVNLREQEQIARQATGRSMQRRQVTLDPRSVTSPRRKRRDPAAPRRAAKATPKVAKRIVQIEGGVSVGELAKQLGTKAAELQGKLMALGTMVSIQQVLDVETARKASAEYGFELQDVGFQEEEFLSTANSEVDESKLVPRPPVVTVMGHVDHGKTSLLDALRKTDVVSGEAGGITQHIGAYQVDVGGKSITFIDTPGHADFTAMRARGAQATDIVILVVAATEGVMPQTAEAIDHARAAGVPIVMAVNKCDLPDANPQQIRQRVMEHNLVPEEFGGDLQSADISATKGTGLENLLEKVMLQAELLELKADPTGRAGGVVLEARLDKGRGPVATVLVQRGTLKRGDMVVAGTHFGRARALYDENGETLKEAGPSAPVEVIGLSGVPEAGELASVVESERVAKEVVQHRLDQLRSRPQETRPRLSLEEFFARQGEGGLKELPLVLKADTHGSLEAVRDALVKQSTDSVKVNVILAGVGAISESDVSLAHTSQAIVVGFHVRPDPVARRASESQGVDVRHYKVIYELVDELRKAMAGLLPPTVREEVLGRVEVRQTFQVPRLGTIAGSYVTDGLVRRNAQCRLLRDGVQVYDGRVGSLRRFKDDVREVLTGFECGVGIEGYSDIKVSDVIEVYEFKEEPAVL